MRFKLTIVLFILNLGMFLAIYLLEKPQQAATEQAQEGGIVDPVMLESDRITLAGNAFESRRVLRREPGTQDAWFLEEPQEWRANPFAINNLLNQLRFASEPVSFRVSEIQNSGKSLADYGLADPLVEVSFSQGERLETVKIGAQTEIGNRVYLLEPRGKLIYVVGAELLSGLLVDLDELRDSRIFTIPPFQVDNLSMRLPREGDLAIRLVREGEGDWAFEAPLSAEADANLVDATLRNLTALEAETFFDAPSTEVTGLSNPALRLTLAGDQQRQTLLLGNEISGTGASLSRYYAKLEAHETVFSILARPFEVLLNAQERLRERRFMRDLSTGDVNSLTIDNNGNVLSLQRLENGNWQILERQNGGIETSAADEQVLERLLEGFRDLAAESFASDAPGEGALREFGLLEPQWTVTFGPSDLTLKISGPQTDSTGETVFYAQRSDASYVYQIPARTSRLLVVNPLAYRDRSLWRLPMGTRIVELRIEDLNEEPARNIFAAERNAATPWEVAVEELPEDRQESTLELLERMRSLEVSRYLSDTFNPEYLSESQKDVRWRFRLVLELELTGGQEVSEVERELFLTERLGGGFQAAGSPGDDVVFALTQPMIESLHPFIFEEPLPEDYVPPEAGPIEEVRAREIAVEEAQARAVENTESKEAADESAKVPEEPGNTDEATDNPGAPSPPDRGNPAG